MENMDKITAIILTLNEELNIEKCIQTIKKITNKIILVDSGSTDKTVEIAKRYGVRIFNHEFETHARQFNWALENIDIETEWIIRLDADERISDQLALEITDTLEKKDLTNVSGFVVKFKTYFLGKQLRWGGVYPFKKMILFKKGFGVYEDKQMDEHIILSSGKSLTFKSDALHYDFKDIYSLVSKHNWYSSKELLDHNEKRNLKAQNLSDKTIKSKRNQKNMYYRFPLFFRAHLLFIFRYIIQLGFLDGKRGLIYHFITTYYYRFVVDARIFEHNLSKKTKG